MQRHSLCRGTEFEDLDATELGQALDLRVLERKREDVGARDQRVLKENVVMPPVDANVVSGCPPEIGTP